MQTMERNEVYLPLASTGSSINDGLRGLNLSEASSVGSESLVISVGMKTSDVHVSVTVNGVGQALIESSHALARSKDSRNSSWDTWVLDEQGINVDVDGDGLVGQRLGNLLVSVLRGELLRRWSRSEWRAIDSRNLGTLLTLKNWTVVGSTWSRLIGSGVRATTILKSGDLLVILVSSLGVVAGGSSAGSVWHDRESRKVARVCSLWEIWHSSSIGTVTILGELGWGQWLSRIHSRSYQIGIVCRIVEVLASTERKLTSTKGRRSSHVGTRHGEVSELAHHLAHGGVVVLAALSIGGGLTLRVAVDA
jgi:hypothetical protein